MAIKFKSKWEVNTTQSDGTKVNISVDATNFAAKMQKLYYAFSPKSAQLENLMQETVDIGAEYAKKYHLWKNRTGMAEKSLYGSVSWERNSVVGNIGHGVSYGVYLELAFQRRYAILEEAAQYAARYLETAVQDGIGKALK